jgi:phosphoenolpyruvate carboxykinase (ATP)
VTYYLWCNSMPTATKSRIESIAQGQFPGSVQRNATPARLYQECILHDKGMITSAGAMATLSGKKTGRSPKDKRIVDQTSVHNDVWWGKVNMPISDDSFGKLRDLAIDFLDNAPRLFVVDGFAGWDPDHRLKIRIICSRPYHALFMHNMLIRPTAAELADFGKPDYVIYNAGQRAADASIDGVDGPTSISLNFESGEMVILGSEYAGEMKKGVFTIMNYLMPKQGIFSMHCSANEGPDGDVSLFFGLSGTGKTTLSADPHRALIGDDEHCWTGSGVFNIEGGCYAKCIGLTREKEPQIYDAIRFGSVLENTVVDSHTHEVDYNDGSLTENTRCSYPIEFISNAKIPCVGGHPKNIVFLTCDAFGVLPPVSRMSPAQAMYHFISGYTAKVAGTEMGVTEPEATFSACFGAAFLVWHPTKYAEQLAEKMNRHGSNVWLVNTGWSGGGYGTGSRISLKHTRAIINAIHDGSLIKSQFAADPVFGLSVPKTCAGVPSEILSPRSTWKDQAAFEKASRELVLKFNQNFEKYSDVASEEIRNAAPKA